MSTGGTEALYSLIVNYRPLKPGDQVILADVDYDEMQYAMAFLETSKQAPEMRGTCARRYALLLRVLR